MIDWKPTHVTSSAPPEFAGKVSDSVIQGIINGVMEFVIVKCDGKFQCTEGWNEDWFDTCKSAGDAKRACEVRWNVKRYDALNKRTPSLLA